MLLVNLDRDCFDILHSFRQHLLLWFEDSLRECQSVTLRLWFVLIEERVATLSDEFVLLWKNHFCIAV